MLKLVFCLKWDVDDNYEKCFDWLFIIDCKCLVVKVFNLGEKIFIGRKFIFIFGCFNWFSCC